MRSFSGGIHPECAKECTAGNPIRKLGPPDKVMILLQQHIGAPCEPLVKVGDKVKTGQKIGDSKGYVSVPVHASISGTVVSIAPVTNYRGEKTPAIIIESDGKDELWEGMVPHDDNIDSLSKEEIRNRIREAGIVGKGGAAFPTHVKLSPPEGKEIDTVILNGCECEPYLTTDHQLMLERTDDVVLGLRLFMKVLGVEKGYIGIEANKLDAAEKLKASLGNDSSIQVVLLQVKYPQGSEKHLIDAILNRKVPSGSLPLDVGVVVNNVATSASCARAVRDGMPFYERVLTVSGPGIKEPSNVEVRVGMSFKDVIEACGGFKGRPGKILMGGPMMGIAQYDLSTPIVKGTSGLLVFPYEEEPARILPCIRCARCADACPMFLLPLEISHFSEKGFWDEAEEYNVLDCIECGACSYVCPAKRPLVHFIRMAKAEILANRRKNG